MTTCEKCSSELSTETYPNGTVDEHCRSCDDDLEHIFLLTDKDLGFCGCGDPAEVYNLVRDVLELFAIRSEYIKTGVMSEEETIPIRQRVRERIGGGDGTYYAVLYWIDHAGLIEHGGSVGGSWLNEKGAHYLSLMQRHCYEDLEGPGCLKYGFPHRGEECGPGCRHWEASYPEWQKKEIIKAQKETST